MEQNIQYTIIPLCLMNKQQKEKKAMKKTNYFIAFIVTAVCLSGETWAASSIRKVGGASGTPNVAARSGSLHTVPGTHAVNTNKSVANVSAVAPGRSSVAGSRLSAGKFVGANKMSVSTTTVTNDLSDRLDVMDENVQTLQEQSANVITNVVESEQGNYVTGVSANGNTLNVSKTNLLYAPVRDGESQDVTGEAEIWLVR